MINYRLGICKNNFVKYVDLSKILGKESRRLTKVDTFTSDFINEQELKLHLLDMDLVDQTDLNNKIKIVYYYNGKEHQLPVVYKLQRKYLEEEFLSGRLLSYSSDIEFLEKLANFYNINIKYNRQYYNVFDIREYIGLAKVRGTTFHSDELNAALNDLFIKAVSKDSKLNYRGLRELGLFIGRYEEQKQAKKYREQINKNKQNIESAQLSVFDAIQPQSENEEQVNTHEEEYIEPYFPPNSEEERKYQKYMETLEKNSNECFITEDIERRSYKK